MKRFMYDYKSPLDTMYQPRPEPRTGKATVLKVTAAIGILALTGIAGLAVASRCGKSPTAASNELLQKIQLTIFFRLCPSSSGSCLYRTSPVPWRAAPCHSPPRKLG